MAGRTTLKRAGKRLVRGVTEHYLLVLLALVSSIAILLAFYLLGGTSAELWPNIAAGFVTSLWTFIILYIFIVRPGVSLPGMHDATSTGALVDFYRSHEDVDWAAITPASAPRAIFTATPSISSSTAADAAARVRRTRLRLGTGTGVASGSGAITAGTNIGSGALSMLPCAASAA